MKIRSIRWGLVLCGGWFLILVSAAIILPPIDSRTVLDRPVPILAIAAVWLLLALVVLPAYFHRAWKRMPLVSNKNTYVAWLIFETACVFASMCGLGWLLTPPGCVMSPRLARERVLRANLATMRAVISQYNLDLHRRPVSLDELVLAGYLREVPTDPMTRRKDTWVVICSNDRSLPGIVGIDSGYGKVSNKGNLSCATGEIKENRDNLRYPK
jgi:general secretion pathway protein G